MTVTCSYPVLGEVDANLTGLLATEQGVTSTFDIQFDDVPVFYYRGNPPVGDPLARTFERASAQLTAMSPITGNTDNLTEALADPVVTGAPNCSSPCLHESAAFVWNHGGIDRQVVTTFLGLIGPGVQNNRIDNEVWSDHVDIRPTMLVLTGLKDDYPSDGRLLAEELAGWALPNGVRDSGAQFTKLARAYKQINAPNADLGRASLVISTQALASGSSGDDSTYINLENDLSAITTQRDTIAAQMADLLQDAEFNDQRIHEIQERRLVQQSQALLNSVEALANTQ